MSKNAMGINTEISFCDDSINLMAGCDGCELWNPKKKIHDCYAGALVARYKGLPGWPEDFSIPAVFPKRIEILKKASDLTGTKRPVKPWLDGFPRVIFCNDLGDMFTESLPSKWIDPFWHDLITSPHQLLFLTKRPRRMLETAKRLTVDISKEDWNGILPQNIWWGTTVTNKSTVKRLEILRQFTVYFENKPAVTWASFEPLLEAITLPDLSWLDWAVVGGMSNSQNISQRSHLEDLVKQLRMQGVRVFFKQWGNDAINKTLSDLSKKSLGGTTKGGREIFGTYLTQMPRL